jgi:hypothetical protein
LACTDAFLYESGMRSLLSLIPTIILVLPVFAEPPSASTQIPDVASFPDRTAALRQQVAETGSLILEPGVHRITGTLEIKLEQKRSTVVRPAGGPATLIMDGPGPAIRIVGSHEGTAGPTSFQPTTWNERMPLLEGFEVLGNHPQADGIQLVKTVEAVVSGVSVRWCRHGIRLSDRNRNVIISDVHLYENSGIGLYLDAVNLHQINVSNSHISYNRLGGIVVRDGNVRNLHITGCDLEANMPADDTHTNSANILIDVSATPLDRRHSVAEVAITGCTIQHSSNYSGKNYDALAPGGANIRILGKEIWPVDSVAITGNVISDTEVHIDISHATDVTLTGNTFFAPNPDFLHVRDSKRVLVNGNTFNPRQFERPGKLLFTRCEDSIVTDCTFRALQSEDGAIRVLDCSRMLFQSNILTESKSGIRIKGSREIEVKDWIVSGLPEGRELIERD